MGIRVNGLDYYVKACLSDLPSDRYGLTDFDTQQIFINDRVSAEKQRQTFWHEVLHTLVEGEEWVNEEAEERFVNRVSCLLYSLLKDNRILTDDWWTRVLDESPDYSQVMNTPIAKVAARGRKYRRTNCRRKK